MQNRMQRPPAADPERHLPLRPVACAVLAALSEAPRSGIDVLDAVNATVPGRPLLGPGTLYRLLRELRQQGLIARTAPAAGGDDDERQVHHVLTPIGHAVLRAEVARLRRTITLAGASVQGTERG
jgi:DNA-binding PadR family transcriptional regulator